MDWMLDGVLDWFAGKLVGALDGLFALMTKILLVTPDVTALPQVQALTGRAVWIVDTVLVLVFLAVGVLTMVSGGDERSRYTVKDLMPRTVVGFVAAHFSQLIAGRMIELANALTAALTGRDLDGDGALQAMRTHIRAAGQAGVPGTQTSGLLFLICVAIIVFLMAATACSAIVRFVVALLLAACGPLALACHALPQTDPIARLWWRSLGAVLAIPALQGLVLVAAQWMLLDPAHMLPATGLPVEPGEILNLLIVIVLLWTCVRVPALVRRLATDGGGKGGFLGMAVRVVAVQQMSRLLPVLGRIR
jgi:hypothetical protein